MHFKKLGVQPHTTSWILNVIKKSSLCSFSQVNKYGCSGSVDGSFKVLKKSKYILVQQPKPRKILNEIDSSASITQLE